MPKARRLAALRLDSRRDTLQHSVDDSDAPLTEIATARTHLPVFVERFAVQRLKALAETNGSSNGALVDVFLICERNEARPAGRSTGFRARSH